MRAEKLRAERHPEEVEDRRGTDRGCAELPVIE